MRCRQAVAATRPDAAPPAGRHGVAGRHAPAPLAGRLLLRDAVHVAATEHDLAPGHGDDATVREHPLQLGLDHGVIRVVEGRQNDAAVDDQEVEVGGGRLVAGPARDGALRRVDAPGLVGRDLEHAGMGSVWISNGRP